MKTKEEIQKERLINYFKAVKSKRLPEIYLPLVKSAIKANCCMVKLDDISLHRSFAQEYLIQTKCSLSYIYGNVYTHFIGPWVASMNSEDGEGGTVMEDLLTFDVIILQYLKGTMPNKRTVDLINQLCISAATLNKKVVILSQLELAELIIPVVHAKGKVQKQGGNGIC